jgi:hypothetical protein
MDAGVCSLGMDRGPAGLYTHGLATIGALAITLAVVYAITSGDALGGFVVCVTVVSHYVLDLVTGIKPTWAGGPIIGLGLYNRVLPEVGLEVATILIGWLLYRRMARSEERAPWTVYAVLLSLIAFQAIGAAAFYLNLGGQTKC